MGGTCSMYGEEERCIQSLGGGNMRERDYLEDPGIDGSVISKWIFRKWDGRKGLDLSRGQEQVAGSCKRSDELFQVP